MTRSSKLTASADSTVDAPLTTESSEMPDDIQPIHVALMKAQEEILLLKHAAEIAQLMKDADIRRSEEVLKVRHEAELERVKLEAAHAVKIKDLELKNFKL